MKKARSQFDLDSLQNFLTSVNKSTDDLISGPGAVGPSVNKAVNIESVRMLLNETGYDNVTVDSCSIPFRG
jgi:hypothetical protein